MFDSIVINNTIPVFLNILLYLFMRYTVYTHQVTTAAGLAYNEHNKHC